MYMNVTEMNSSGGEKVTLGRVEGKWVDSWQYYNQPPSRFLRNGSRGRENFFYVPVVLLRRLNNGGPFQGGSCRAQPGGESEHLDVSVSGGRGDALCIEFYI
jgi:hypothetical protein